MLWTLITVLLVLWLFGVVANATMGGLIHLLLLLAAVVLVMRFIGGRRAV